MYIYIYYTLTTFKHTDSIMLDNLQEGFPWPARRFKHTESSVYIEIYIDLNVRMELVFQTTSGGSWSGPPCTYLNVVPVYLKINNQLNT